MSIVCGTDFSEGSNEAVTAAAAIAGVLKDSPLWLVHVLRPAMEDLDDPQAWQVRKERAAKKLGEQAVELQRRTGIASRTSVLEGSAATAILEFARVQKADLVIVSSAARAPRTLGLGGTAQRVARLASLPVLIVHGAAPFEAWACHERPLRILLGADSTESTKAAVRWIRRLRMAGPCDVTVAHVYSPDFAGEGPRRYGLPWHLSPPPADEPEVERLLERDLTARLGELGGTGEVAFRIEPVTGRVGEHLIDLAEETHADLILVGSHRRRGLSRLGSVSSAVLRNGVASVACVPLPSDVPLTPDAIPRVERVLVPTDFSALANYAVPYAYALASERGGEVVLFHVLPMGKMEDAEVQERLRMLVREQAAGEGVSTRLEVVHHADPADAICESAERLRADAICMASRGISGVKRAIMGSTAEAVMHRSRKPVLLLRAPEP